MIRLLVALFSLLIPGTAIAAPERLTDDTLRHTLAGARLEIDAPLGLKLPVQFLSNGLMEGTAGELSAYLGAARDRGRWWIAQDELCAKWFRWFDAQSRCLKLWRDGSRIHWQEAKGEDRGTATLIASADTVPLDSASGAPAEPVRSTATASSTTSQSPAAMPPPKSSGATVSSGTQPAPEAAAPRLAVATVAPSHLLPASSAELVGPDGPAAGQEAAGEARAPVSAPSLAAPVTSAKATAVPEPDTPDASLGSTEPVAPKSSPLMTVAGQPVILLNPESAGAASTPANALPALGRTMIAFSAAAEAARAATMAGRGWPAATVSHAHRQPTPGRRVSAAAPVPAPPAPQLYRVVHVEPDDVLNVRSGPSEYHAAVGYIPPTSRTVRILGRCQVDWCPVRHGRVTGWVNSFYLDNSGADATTRIGLR